MVHKLIESTKKALGRREKMSNQDVDIREGTITFWIDKGEMKFNDNKFIPLIQHYPRNGIIFIDKDRNNKLKFSLTYIGKGTTGVEYDVSSLNPDKRHMIAVTWSLNNREIIMYIDGKEVAKKQINY